jgi:FMN reductase (NADPH)
MKETLELLLKHRSIRKFTNQPVPENQFEAIIAAAQRASTSSNMQAYSVIRVQSPELRKALAELAGHQAYIFECAEFLVWCADLHRLQHTCGLYGKELARTTENFVIATVDASLAAQNAAVAAEAMGLGIVYIGGIRNQIEQVSELLKLPELVYPVFGMCIGYPEQAPDQRPRLPQTAVVHTDVYDEGKHNEEVASYDREYRSYILERSGGKRDTVWSREMSERASKPLRLQMKPFLKSKGFLQE